MIRMFISDLDGTLLNKYHIADKTINQAIEEADRRGYRFAVATGRHMRNHQRFGLGFLKHTQYIIAMNGALVIKLRRVASVFHEYRKVIRFHFCVESRLTKLLLNHQSRIIHFLIIGRCHKTDFFSVVTCFGEKFF